MSQSTRASCLIGDQAMDSSREQQKEVQAWYVLRRTLPPWSFEKNLQELVKCLPRYRVNEIIVKVDTEEFTHGQPPLKWVKRYQKNLFRLRDEMKNMGILYSLNPWITVGHNDRGRDARRLLPGLRTMVGHDGTKCTCCACPLSPVWRENTSRVWTIYAQTRPHVIWVEDDIRTFNHAPVRFGCFCFYHRKREVNLCLFMSKVLSWGCARKTSLPQGTIRRHRSGDATDCSR